MIQNRLKAFLPDLSRRKVLCTIISLFMISVSFNLLFLDEVDKHIKSSLWEGPLDFDTSGGGVKFMPKYNNFNPNGLTNYIVKLNFAIEGLGLDVSFCKEYSWILDLAEPIRTGFYRDINKNGQVLVSKFDYNKEPIFKKLKKIRNKIGPDTPLYKADNIQLILKCDLIERTAIVYLNNEFCEKINLNGNNLEYLVKITNFGNTRVFLKKMQVSNNKGEVFFEDAVTFKFPYKTVSRIVFFFGLAMLSLFLFAEEGFLIRFLCLIAIILITEAYLRTTEKDNPYLNTHVMKAYWNVEKTTNLFGNYNNTDTIEICNLWRKEYPIAKPKDSLRIICLGSSPVEGVNVSSYYDLFTSVLEKNISENGKRRCEVINAGITGYDINIGRDVIYFSDVLIKLDPDLVIIYGIWGEDAGDIDLYKRMKKLLQDHSSWIINQRMLRMALEFKHPVKEIVYLYNLLSESYLFMGIEYVRGKIITSMPFIVKSAKPDFLGKREFSFKKILKLCKKRNIKILLMPQYDFIKNSVDKNTLKKMQEIQKLNNNVFCLNMEEAFLRNKEYILSFDSSHITEYGYKVIAEELYRKLINDGLISGYSN